VLAHAELDADRPRRERLRDQLAAEAKKVDAALDRYFDSLLLSTYEPTAEYPIRKGRKGRPAGSVDFLVDWNEVVTYEQRRAQPHV
jgi:hypothetical protein